MQTATAFIFVTLLAAVFILASLDRRKRRPLVDPPAVSFLVPVYNDGATVVDTLESIRCVAGSRTDIVVIDDASTDDTYQRLCRYAQGSGIRVLRNPHNRGKSNSLNDAVRFARHEILLFVDADVVVNESAFRGVLARLGNERVGAVSWPYAPCNGGFIPVMLHIEYNMLALVQGAYNLTSAMSLWGGFLAVRRKAFAAAGGFSVDAITEDMDLAFKLDRLGWKVEQSFVAVATHVPDSVPDWYRQKLRWYTGGLQAAIRHWPVWIKNPIHIALVSAMGAFVGLSLAALVRELSTLQNVMQYFALARETLSLLASLKLIGLVYGASIVENIAWMLAFTLVALPWIFPLITGVRKLHLVALVVPFSIIYMPVSMGVLASAAMMLIVHVSKMKPGSRAW